MLRSRNQSVIAIFLLAFATLAWGGNIVIGRAIRGEVPPLGLSFWRWLVAFIILMFFVYPKVRNNWSVLCREWKLLLVTAALGMASFHPLQYFAVQTTMAINATLILSTSPAFMALLSYFFIKERLTLLQFLGAAISFFGVAVVMTRADLAVLQSLTFTQGDILMLGAALVWAFYSIAVKMRPADMDPYAMLAAVSGLGALLLLPFYIWESMTVQAMPLTSQSIVTVGYVTVFASLLAYLAFNQGVNLIGPSRAGIMLHLIPVWVTLLAVIFLGERLESHHIAGLVLIAIGIFLNNKPAKRD